MKLGWDDTLDVWGVHGMGGFIGTVLLGALADGGECAPEMGSAVVPPAYCVNPGTITRSGAQFGIQLTAALFCAVYSMVVTLCILKGINLMMPILPQAKGFAKGASLDLHELGEEAYTPTKPYVLDAEGRKQQEP